MKRNVISLLGAVGMLAGLASCSGGTSSAQSSGNVINIWCWNNEFQSRFNKYYPEVEKVDGDTTTLKNGKTVKFTIHPNDNNGYQNALDAALKKQDTAKADDKIDIFLMEADYALKYVNADYTMDVKDLGITDSDTAQMYDYTKTIATSSDGKLKGLSWQATPGLYAFRTDYAKKIWGDAYPADPEPADSAEVKATKTQAQADFVQSKMSDWTKFNEVAAAAKAKDVKIVSGFDDTYRTYSNNATKPWVDSNDTVTIDPEIKKWIKNTKEYATNGYCGTSKLWDDNWAKDQGPTGSVLGFFYSTWGINFTLAGNSLADSKGEQKLGNGLFGKYRVCQGPASYYWGGTWISAAKGTDNVDDIKDIMLKLTCDKAIAKKITQDTQDYTNNKAAMNEIANDKTFGSDFLGGQNHIKLFTNAAANIKLAAMSPYDQTCNEQLQNAMRDYFTGTTADYAAAYESFKAKVKEKHPDLKFNDTANSTL